MTMNEKQGRLLTVYDDETNRPLVQAVVSEEVFRAYHRVRNHGLYVQKKARCHEWSYDAYDVGNLACDTYLDYLTAGRQAAFSDEAEEVQAALAEALLLLEPEMREALWQLVLGETTERELAARWGVSKTVVHRRKGYALRTLREALVQKGVGRA